MRLGSDAGEVESVDVEHPAVDDHHLAVVADQIVGSPGNRDARLEQLHLQLAQVLGAAAIGMRRQRAHVDAAGDGRLERARDLKPVEAKDEQVDRLRGLLDRVHDRCDSVVGLNDELHTDR